MLKELLFAALLINFAYGECPSVLVKDVPCYSVATTCYCFSYTQENWTTAASTCRGNDAHSNFRLISIESFQEQAVIESFIASIPGIELYNPYGFWTSGNDRDIEGAWIWSSTADELTYTNWNAGQPDNSQNYLDCLLLNKTAAYTWDDDNCNSARAFICEGPASGL